MENTLEALQENLGYRFKNIRLLETALTHSSYANENGTVCFFARFVQNMMCI